MLVLSSPLLYHWSNEILELVEMNYEALLSPARLRPSTQAGRDLATEVLSDKARLVLSASFRRLQTKAQVFSLENNAAVRSRLTHSLEVAMYGELIAGKTFGLLLEKRLIDQSLHLPFVTTVENACLLHDIGNPPFGHLGEFAIRRWFESFHELLKQWKEAGIPDDVAQRHFESLANFDGNAQGFRNVTKLQWLEDEYGLNLTCNLLACMIKYLTDSKPKGYPFDSKLGFFPVEADTVVDIWQRLGLRIEAGRPVQRHPLTFLMEAADDVAYCVSDIEDALEKRVVSERDFFDSISDESKALSALPSSPHSKNAAFIKFRIGLTRFLVDKAAELFVANHSLIASGQLDKPLFQLDERAAAMLRELKDFSKKHIFSSAEAINVELSGFNIVRGLLDGLRDLLKLQTTGFQKLLPDSTSPPQYKEMTLEKRLFSLLPNKHRLAYQHAVSRVPISSPYTGRTSWSTTSPE